MSSPTAGAPGTAGTGPVTGPIDPPERAVHVLAIRHGESEWNAAGRWQGQSDVPLSPLGREQAEAAGEVLGQGPRFDAIVASDLERARVTAAIIGEVIGTDVAFLDPRLRENHAGEWEGLTRDDIDRDWPGYLAVEGRPPGFEPAERTVARVRAALLDLPARVAGERVLLIGHSGALRALRRSLGGDDLRIPNLAGFWFTVSGGELTTGDPVILLGEDATLVE